MNEKLVFIIKLFLVLVAILLATLVFGLFVPMFLLAVGILPSLGVGGIVYLFVGGILGLIFSSISCSVSLFRSKKLLSRYYIVFVICLLLLSLLYLLSYTFMSEAYSHV